MGLETFSQEDLDLVLKRNIQFLARGKTFSGNLQAISLDGQKWCRKTG